jgi:heme exporter protein D
MLEWFAMGGYALYVWGSFSVTAACMLLEPLLLHRNGRRIRLQIARQQDQETTP